MVGYRILTACGASRRKDRKVAGALRGSGLEGGRVKDKERNGVSSGPARRGTIMVVDDTPLAVDLYASLLQEAGFDVVYAGSAREAIDCARYAQDIRLLITDYEMPGSTGSELARWFRTHRAGTPVLILSASPDLLRLAAREAPFAARLEKDAPVEHLMTVVRMLAGDAAARPAPDSAPAVSSRG